jgi:putative transposase
VELIQTGIKGALYGTREEAQSRAGGDQLRQIEVSVANGKTTSVACKEAGITDQTFYRWRKEYGGLQVAATLSADPLRERLKKRGIGLPRLPLDHSQTMFMKHALSTMRYERPITKCAVSLPLRAVMLTML